MTSRPTGLRRPGTRARRARGAALLLAAWAGAAQPAPAQDWPAVPLAIAGGRVTFAGQAVVTAAPSDEGYFNYSNYDRNLLQLIRFDLTTAARFSPRLSALVELRAEGDTSGGPWNAGAYAAYLRVRPWPDRPFEIHGGLVPPAFGAFPRRAYGTDNPLIGYPLAYQYLTSLRSDAIPATADDLLRMRGRGWYTGYPIGNPAWDAGVPLATVVRYDAGVLARAGTGASRAEVVGSVTAGTLSNPRDRSAGPQVAGRVVLRPAAGLAVGASAAAGSFVDRSIQAAIPAGASAESWQRVFGADVEYARGHWLARSEVVVSGWRLPVIGEPRLDPTLVAASWLVEARYKLRPGLYAAARYDCLSFDDVRGTTGPAGWEAGVQRVEAGIGVMPVRNVLLKLAVQHNWRDTARASEATFGAAQVIAWF